jgi:hypothetical protein
VPPLLVFKSVGNRKTFEDSICNIKVCNLFLAN